VIKMESLAMRRILGVEKKKRVCTCVYIEEELFKILKENYSSLSNVINLAIEKFLRDEGLID